MSPQEKAAAEAASFVAKLNEIILFPTIALLSGVALLVFLYGLAEYLMNSSNETARADGKKHITYGIIGLVVMISAYALLSIAVNTFGMSKQLDCANDPAGTTGCDDVFKVN